MTTQAEVSLLRDFFGAYFHEDWNYDAQRPESIVRGFVAEATPEKRTVLADAIVKYAAGFPSDKELEKHPYYTQWPRRRILNTTARLQQLPIPCQNP